MPRLTFEIAPSGTLPAGRCRAWYEIYWGRLRWVARLRIGSSSRAMRGSCSISLSGEHVGLVRSIVIDEVREAMLAADPLVPAAVEATPARPAAAAPEDLLGPPAPAADGGIRWPQPLPPRRPATAARGLAPAPRRGKPPPPSPLLR